VAPEGGIGGTFFNHGIYEILMMKIRGLAEALEARNLF